MRKKIQTDQENLELLKSAWKNTCKVSLRSLNSPCQVSAVNNCRKQGSLQLRKRVNILFWDLLQEKDSKTLVAEMTPWEQMIEHRRLLLPLYYHALGFCCVFSQPHQFPTIINNIPHCAHTAFPWPLLAFDYWLFTSAYDFSLQFFPGNVQMQLFSHCGALQNHLKGRLQHWWLSLSPTDPPSVSLGEGLGFAFLPNSHYSVALDGGMKIPLFKMLATDDVSLESYLSPIPGSLFIIYFLIRN